MVEASCQLLQVIIIITPTSFLIPPGNHPIVTSIPRSLIHHFPHTITHCGRHKIPHSHSNHDYKLLTTASSLLARLDSRSRKDARNFRFSWSQGLKTTDRGVSSGLDITYQPTTYSLLYIPWWVSIHVTHTRRLLPMPGYRRVGGLLHW